MSNSQRDTPSTAPPFALALARDLHDRLGQVLVGVYLHGSVATGDQVPGRSDLDLIAICDQPLTGAQRDSLRTLLLTTTPPRDLPAVDLGVLTAATAAHPKRPMHWELMMRSQRDGDRVTLTDLGGYPGDLLDREMARQHGVALFGPEPGELFAPMPPAWVLEACAEELRVWARRRHYEDPASGVLNACRAWRYAEEGTLSSKAAGGAWARSRTTSPLLIDAALAIRKGDANLALPDAEVNTFVRQILRQVEDAANLLRGDPCAHHAAGLPGEEE